MSRNTKTSAQYYQQGEIEVGIDEGEDVYLAPYVLRLLSGWKKIRGRIL